MYAFPHRVEQAYQALKKENLDGLIISHQPNIIYLTGFPSRDSYLLISKKHNFFITDFRYLEEAKRNLRGFTVKKTEGSVFAFLASLITKAKLKRIGFEAKSLPFAEYKKIKEHLSYEVDFVATHDLIEKIRQIKEKKEIEAIKTAIQMTTEAFRYARTILKEGMKEIELAAKIEYSLKSQGLGMAFEIIVASGPNSAFPHHISSEKRIKRGEPVLIDIGASYQGYKSDLTRVFFLGKITPLFRRTYDIVLTAQGRAIKSIKPGIFINKVDGAARQYITQKGYSPFFGHGLGHGIGLEVHEEPPLSAKNRQRLKEGMVFTIEPAIYLPGRFGVRIEDMVLVTRRGSKVLSDHLHKSI